MEMPNFGYKAEEYRYGFNGMEKDNEMKGKGNSYDYGARMYDPRVGRWFSLDPYRQKYSSVSPYHFGFNNPIITIDPNGKENIVVVGMDKANNNQYNFVQSGLLKVKDYLKQDETTTIMIYSDNETKKFNAEFKSSVHKLYGDAVNVVEFSTDDNLTNYLNSKDTQKKALSIERLDDKITDISIFGHGLVSEKGGYEPNYTRSLLNDRDESSWSIEDIENLKTNAFDNPMIYLFTCNAATANKEGNSIAKSLSKQSNGKIVGWAGRTDYGNINDVQLDWFNRQLAKHINKFWFGTIKLEDKKHDASDRLPTGSTNVKKKTFNEGEELNEN